MVASSGIVTETRKEVGLAKVTVMERSVPLPRLIDTVGFHVAGPTPLGRLAEARQHVMAKTPLQPRRAATTQRVYAVPETASALDAGAAQMEAAVEPAKRPTPPVPRQAVTGRAAVVLARRPSAVPPVAPIIPVGVRRDGPVSVMAAGLLPVGVVVWFLPPGSPIAPLTPLRMTELHAEARKEAAYTAITETELLTVAARAAPRPGRAHHAAEARPRPITSPAAPLFTTIEPTQALPAVPKAGLTGAVGRAYGPPRHYLSRLLFLVEVRD